MANKFHAYFQVGKKPRNGKYGACFFSAPTPPDMEKENEDTESVVSTGTVESSCEYILAARPNGRLWEANSMGVVYRYVSVASQMLEPLIDTIRTKNKCKSSLFSTHQFRQVSTFSFAPPLSAFRVDNAWTSTARRPEEETRSALSFASLHPIQSSRSDFVHKIHMFSSIAKAKSFCCK